MRISDWSSDVCSSDLWTAEGEVAALRSGDVAAFSVHDDNGERVVVLFECRSNDPQLRETIGAEVAGVLRARHGVHADVIAVPPRALPQTSYGKFSRARARPQLGRAHARTPVTNAESVSSDLI